MRRSALARRTTANRRKSSVRLSARAPVQENVSTHIPLSTSGHVPDRNRSEKPFSPEPEMLFSAVCGRVVRAFIVFSVLVVCRLAPAMPGPAHPHAPLLVRQERWLTRLLLYVARTKKVMKSRLHMINTLIFTMNRRGTRFRRWSCRQAGVPALGRFFSLPGRRHFPRQPSRSRIVAAVFRPIPGTWLSSFVEAVKQACTFPK